MFRRYVTFEDLPEVPPIAWEEVFLLAHEAMAEVTEMLRREVMARTPIGASGNLRGSIYTEIKGEDPQVLRGVVASRVPYAKIRGIRTPGGRRNAALEGGVVPVSLGGPQTEVARWVYREGVLSRRSRDSPARDKWTPHVRARFQGKPKPNRGALWRTGG